MVSASSSSAPSPSKHIQVKHALKPSANVTCAAELRGSEYLLTGDAKGFLSVWYVGSEHATEEDANHAEPAHNGSVTKVLVLRHRRMVVALRELELQRAKLLEAGPPGKERFFSRVWHTLRPPKGDCGTKPTAVQRWLVVSAGNDGALRFWAWSLERQRHQFEFRAEFLTEWLTEVELGKATEIVDCLEVHDGLLALALKDSQDIRILDPATATVTCMLYGHTGAVLSLAECCDGRLASGGRDGAVRLWWRAQRVWEGCHEQKDGDALRAAGHAASRGQTPLALADAPGAAPGGSEKASRPAANASRAAVETGVCSTAFFAHTQQLQKGEYVNVLLRIMVYNAEGLPSLHSKCPSAYVSCSLAEGDPRVAVEYLKTSAATRDDNRCILRLRKALIEGKWRLPDCTTLTFEVCKGNWRTGKDTVLLTWSIPAWEALRESSVPDQRLKQTPRKLVAPLDKEPGPPDAALLIGFGRVENSQGPQSGALQSGAAAAASAVSAGEASATPEVALAVCVHSSVGIKGKGLVVRVTANEGRRGYVRTSYTKRPCRTAAAAPGCSPAFSQVLEIEVPGSLVGNRIVYNPKLHLEFEVHDERDGHDKSDGPLAKLCLPLSEAINGIEPLQHELTCDLAYKGLSRRSKMAEQRCFLSLAVQAVVPCPVQLKCTIERGINLPRGSSEKGPSARVRLAYGHPLLPVLSSARTVAQRGAAPVWNERCVLTLPDWLLHDAHIVAPSTPDEPRNYSYKESVRAGWEHDEVACKGNPFYATICVDVYNDVGGASVSDDPVLCSCNVGLQQAFNIAREGNRPKGVKTTLPPALLQLALEQGPGPSQISVVVASAEHLPAAAGEGGLRPYCVVRLAHWGAFGPSSSRSGIKSWPVVQTPNADSPHQAYSEWLHEGVLELPGLDIDGKVAAMPNWHLLFEALDGTSWEYKEKVLAHGSMPVSEVLQLLATPESGEVASIFCSPASSKAFETPSSRGAMDELIDEDVDFRASASQLRAPGALMPKRPPKMAPPPVEAGNGKEVTFEVHLIPTSTKKGHNLMACPLSTGELAFRERCFRADDIRASPISTTARSGFGVGHSARSSPMSTAQSGSAWRQNHQLATLGMDPPATPGAVATSAEGAQAAAFREDDPFDGAALVVCFSLEPRQAPPSVENPDAKATGPDTLAKIQHDGEDAVPTKMKPIKYMMRPSPVTSILPLVTTLVAGHDNGNVFVWDITGITKAPLHGFEAHSVPVSRLAFLAPLDVVVSTGSAKNTMEAVTESTLRVWSSSTFQLRNEISLHGASTRCLKALEQDPQDGTEVVQPPLLLGADTKQSRLLQVLHLT